VTRKRLLWLAIGAACVLGLVGTCAFLFGAFTLADHESLTTNTNSAQLKTSAERVAFLRRYLKLRTRVSDASFHIWYQDNSIGLPGPSDWSIVAAVRVTPADGQAWLADASPLTPGDPRAAWLPLAGGNLIPREWAASSPGVPYTRDGELLVWHSEGVLEFAAATEGGAPSVTAQPSGQNERTPHAM
jgi:hypothetical protein